jgi:hypothetical protein
VTPETIAAALERLRAAGTALRARPYRETLDALAAALDAWCDPASPWQERLVDELPARTGFSRETVREGLRRGLAPYTGAALRSLVAGEVGSLDRLDASAGPHAEGFDTTAALLAGAIPMTSVATLVAPLALRSPVLAKTAARDPLTAGLFAETLAGCDAPLGACIEVVDFRGQEHGCTDALLAADCVVVTGSDETVAAVAARVTPPRRLVAYGHRLSVAALGPEATRGPALRAAAEGLALDVALWDQLGCLSPVAVFAAEGAAGAADRVADALADALARAELRWPRGAVEPAAAAAIARERAEAEMRAAAGRAVSLRTPEGGTAWTVIRECDTALRPAPLHRFVRVHPVADATTCREAIRPLGPHLAGVALAGFGAHTGALAQALAALGASRVCAPGQLQSPPLSWRHDNRGVLEPLVRWCDLEVG